MKLFDDMSPTEKLDHIVDCMDDAWKHLQAEHGPVHLANIVDVWDYWVPYLLERCRKLEKVADVARRPGISDSGFREEHNEDDMDDLREALAALGETP